MVLDNCSLKGSKRGSSRVLAPTAMKCSVPCECTFITWPTFSLPNHNYNLLVVKNYIIVTCSQGRLYKDAGFTETAE